MTTPEREPVICRLSEASVPDLVALDLECNRPPWTTRLFEQEFQHEHSRTFGARLNGKLAGFLCFHILFDEAHILNFGVRKSMRSRGIGRQLLTHVLRDMGRLGIRSVILEARKSNQAAIGLYSSLGFYEVALRKAYYSDDSEDGVMLKLDIVAFVSQPMESSSAVNE